MTKVSCSSQDGEKSAEQLRVILGQLDDC